MNEDGIKSPTLKADANWRAPSELARSTPRSVCLTWRGILVTCLAVLLVGGGIALGAWLYLQAGRGNTLARRMAAEGVVTSGVVTDVGPPRGEERRHKVYYRYEVDGRTYNSNTTVGSGRVGNLRAGHSVAVRYLRTEPARSWMVRHEPSPTPNWTPLVGVGLWLPAVLIFLQIRRQRSLLAEGRVALGSVTGVRWVSSQHGGHYRISYQFQAAGGETYKGGFQSSKKKFGATGTPLTILYDQDNPKRNGPYPMQFVKIEEW